MRLWSLHFQYLDSKGLVALWRESLLAKNVLLGLTKGYRNHPQLDRFRTHPKPREMINYYLCLILGEAKLRGYRFDESKVHHPVIPSKLPLKEKQLSYEFALLMGKLEKRNPEYYNLWKNEDPIKTVECFYLIPGEIESWERRKEDL